MSVQRIWVVLLLVIGGLLAPAPAEAVAAGSVTMAIYPGSSGLPVTVPATHLSEAGEYLMAAGQVSRGSFSLLLQRRSPGGSWRDHYRTTAAADGGYWLLLRAAGLGQYEYRMIVARSATRSGAVSAVWSLQVVRPVNTLSAVSQVTSRLVSGVGTVMPARPGAVLDVQVLQNGRWNMVARIAQGAGGRYQFAVLPPASGSYRYRTVSMSWMAVGSAAQSVLVTGLPRPTTLTLGDLDGDTGVLRTPPRAGFPQAGPVRLSEAGRSPGYASYHLTPGLRSFRATLRLVSGPGERPEDMLVTVRTERRTYLSRWFTAGTVQTVVLDVTGAEHLLIQEFNHGWTTLTTAHLIMERASLSTEPRPERGAVPAGGYLADLPRTGSAGCTSTGLSVVDGEAAPASVVWSGCPEGTTVTYALHGEYTRLRATLGTPAIGGDAYPIEGGMITVTADGRQIAQVATNGGPRAIDVDLTAVESLSFTLSVVDDYTTGYAALVTPLLTPA